MNMPGFTADLLEVKTITTYNLRTNNRYAVNGDTSVVPQDCNSDCAAVYWSSIIACFTFLGPFCGMFGIAGQIRRTYDQCAYNCQFQ